MIIGLALVTKYSYIDPKSHYHEDTCRLDNCTSISTVCYYHNGYRYPCYEIETYITLNPNNVSKVIRSNFLKDNTRIMEYCQQNYVP